MRRRPNENCDSVKLTQEIEFSSSAWRNFSSKNATLHTRLLTTGIHASISYLPSTLKTATLLQVTAVAS